MFSRSEITLNEGKIQIDIGEGYEPVSLGTLEGFQNFYR